MRPIGADDAQVGKYHRSRGFKNAIVGQNSLVLEPHNQGRKYHCKPRNQHCFLPGKNDSTDDHVKDKKNR